MVWWPFAAALQGEAANHREVRRLRAGVLSVAETARCQRVRCGSRRRAKAIPPLKCRKRIDDVLNRGRVVAPGRAWREPADWPGGVRHEGGASVVWALVRNSGTCRLDGAAG